MLLFGIFKVVPYAGFLGIIWIVVTLGITIYHGMNVFSKNGVAFGYVEKKNKRILK
ncbi:hypothetical protein SK3146_02634 [Paenibacillus konkukensis]|uniref:Uncharacterized protein n=1 Tax=Paenibacillus konkukensis TaxID=2020716 RepID=A0ABY4RMZ9_9BACL|nr:hypothetical protein SK3146_02634 [Paenibacillus konkukensis]